MNRRRTGFNLAVGLLSSLWAGIASIIAVPFYLTSLGQASFGLIIFATTLQGLFAILDLGLSTSINREVARATADPDKGEIRDLVHSLACVYWTMAIAAGLLIVVAAGPIARGFLNSPALHQRTVIDAVRLMAVLVALRLPAGLYTGVLMGGQRVAAASAVAIVTTTLSTFGVLAVFQVAGPGIATFFLWQAFIAGVGAALLWFMAWRTLPRARSVGTGLHYFTRPRFSAAQLQRIWRFSTTIALGTVVGALLLQLDKLVLARHVPLEEVGRYGIAGLASRALLLLVAPVFTVFYPRLTELLARGETAAFIALYRAGTRALAVILAVATLYVTLQTYDLVALWTHSPDTAVDVRWVVPLLMAGTALNGIMYMPHALQLAHGNARLGLWVNLAMLAFFAPALFVLVPTGGIIGASIAWLGANIVNFVVGTWLTHRALLPGTTARWLVTDVAAPAAIACAVPLATALLLPLPAAPLPRLALAAFSAGIGILIGLAFNPMVKDSIGMLKKRRL